MKTQSGYVVALVTAPDLKTARALARSALTARLVACVNLVPGLESHYWWQGKLERSREMLLVLKTTASRLRKLEALIRAAHPYDTPEFIVLPIVSGSRRYLDWLTASVARRDDVRLGARPRERRAAPARQPLPAVPAWNCDRRET